LGVTSKISNLRQGDTPLKKYRVAGLDRHAPPHQAECICFGITDQTSVDRALAKVRLAYGERIAACVLLAAFFDPKIGTRVEREVKASE
jgi:hypothetical protein